MDKKRITYFDLAKGIGIIFVVIGHMQLISQELRIYISSFHMPLFFIISGMLMAVKNEVDIDNSGESIKGIIKKKAKGILIPYMWFSLIYVPIDVLNLFVLDNVDEHTFVQNLLDSLTFAGISVMWFLPALFIAEVVALWLISQIGSAIEGKILVRLSNKYEKQIGYISVCVIALILFTISYKSWDQLKVVYNENSSNYVTYTMLGLVRTILRGICMSLHVVIGFTTFKIIAFVESKYLERKKDDVAKANGKNEIKGFSIAIGVICLALNIGCGMKNGAVDNHFLMLNSLTLYLLSAFFGSMAIILISKGIDSIKFIDFFGKNSLIVMATHLQCYILYAGILVAINIDKIVTRAKSYVFMFNSVLFTMIFEALLILVINKFFPFIVGKISLKNWINNIKNKSA